MAIALLGKITETQGQFNSPGSYVRMDKLGKGVAREQVDYATDKEEDRIAGKTPVTPTSPRFHPPLTRISVTSGKGWRTHPVTRARAFHGGIDLKAYYEPVHSVMDGRVESTGSDPVGAVGANTACRGNGLLLRPPIEDNGGERGRG